MTTVDLSWKLRAQKAEARVRELREALDKYGEHSSICDKWSRPNFGGPYICTCGFEAALTRMKEGVK